MHALRPKWAFDLSSMLRQRAGRAVLRRLLRYTYAKRTQGLARAHVCVCVFVS